MTPKQREIVSNLQEKIRSLEFFIGQLRKELYALPGYFDSTADQYKGEFTSDEINGLLRFN